MLLLDDHSAEGSGLQLQSIAHGVLMVQSLDRTYGIKRRRLEVRKLRGAAFREGFHDFSIKTGGVVVYPRLVAAEHKLDFCHTFVSSGVEELDRLLGGGIDGGTSTLLMGPAGCGKSTLAARYALSAAQRKEAAVIFAFDESTATYLHRSKLLGMDLAPYVETGKVRIEQIDPAELSPGEFVARIRNYVEKEHVRIVVLDSLNGFVNAMPDEQFLMLQLHELLSYLDQHGIATIITMAQHGFFGSAVISPIDVSYLADTVILFRYFEHAGQVKQAISVLKKRSGAHERTIRELTLGSGGVKVGPALDAFEGVLTGTPKFKGKIQDLGSRDISEK